ncbi:MAG: MMPL family transporter [Clostridiales bacterium]|nr:MMPL family transporter [Clostridiales bacterium]
MRKIYSWIVGNPKKILVFFFLAAVCGAVLHNLVEVNYDMTDYLPADTGSTVSLELMHEEFDGGIPNARVMIRDVSIAQALEYKEKLKNCEGVTAVLWLDDAVSIYQPLEMADAAAVETYYKDNTALFTVTVKENDIVATVDRIREIIGEDNAMTGDAVSTAVATTGTVNEIRIITVFSVLFVLLVLFITTTSWTEPLVVLLGLGVAIMINSGSNLIFGKISFVTNAACAILQLAVSLDYSVFLLHRYEECLRQNYDKKSAMVDALCKSASSIASSGLTTVIGFFALVFMRFGIGPDLGLALAKGVAISLVTVFVFMPVLILSVYPLIEKTRHKKLMPEFKRFGRLVSRIMIPMALVFIIVAVPSFMASNSNAYYYGASRIYGEDTQYGRDTAAIENTFGKNDTYVLMVPNGDVKAEQSLSDALHEIPEITSILSYVDTVGAEIPKEYLDAGTLAQLVSDDYNRFVLSVEVNYEGEETFDLVERIRRTADTYYPGAYYLAGEGVSTYDLMDTITADTLKVNLIAIGAVFVILLLTMKSLTLPVILVFAIEAAIWINIGIPYFADSVVQYIAYLIISSIQLGATVDYAILFTDRYLEHRQTMPKKQAVVETVSSVTTSILTSGTVLSVVGFLLSYLSSHRILSQLGLFLGRGTLLSMAGVFFVLPGLLYIFDGLVRKTTMKLHFYNPGKEKKSNDNQEIHA